ncbi:hypothetical protein BDD12DRAFT_323589 [Trichophaea hybrida]|nr:hypothetical protein BDD12DRAFT_323589 [Trichophaea hybrida]
MRSDPNQDEDSTDDEADGTFDNCISSHRDSEPGIGEELSGSGGFGGGSSGGGGFVVAVPKLLRKLLEQLAPLENVNWKDWFHDADEYYYCYGDEPLFEEEGGQVGARLLPSDHNRFHNRSDEPIDSSSYYDSDDDVEYLSTETEKKEKSRRHSLTERVMLTARQLIEPSSHRRTSRSKTERPERVYRSKDETPEEKELRREERRIKKLERDARKAAEAAALLGMPKAKKHRSGRDKAKGKEILGSDYESKREKKPKVYHDEVLSGLALRRPMMTVKRTGSPKRETARRPLENMDRNIVITVTMSTHPLSLHFHVDVV